MADSTATPEPILPPTASGAAGTDGQLVVSELRTELDNWKKRFTGLQPLYQRQQSENEALKAAKFDLEQKHTSVTGEYEALKLERQKLQEQHAVTEGELAKLRTSAARMNLIVTEFPGLMEYEAKGLLPVGDGEDFKAKLLAFSGLLKAQGQAAAVNLVSGATPPAPASGGPRIAKDILMEANAALREGKIDIYNKLYDEFIKAKA